MKKHKKMMLIPVIIAILVVGVLFFLAQPKFGRAPQAISLKQIENSQNYRNGKFQNYVPRIDFFANKSFFQTFYDFMFKKVKDLKPKTALPSIKTNLKSLNRQTDIMIWFGHSSVFIQIDGVRFLLDPVLVAGSPVSFFNKPFLGTNIYKPEDIPDIDYLLISHDHWDHLDYEAVVAIKDRIGKVICGLGTGEHFRHWGYENSNIIELDWNTKVSLKGDIVLHILPAQHFSGRKFLGGDKSLWVSFMLEAPSLNIFISGDSGFGKHFAEIGNKFQKIDLALLEFGQYDQQWRDIHVIPADMPQVIADLHVSNIFMMHNSKFALGNHSWKEPLEQATKLAKKHNFSVITPMIGEVVRLKDPLQKFSRWWENVK